jgi:hypothetical protein
MPPTALHMALTALRTPEQKTTSGPQARSVAAERAVKTSHGSMQPGEIGQKPKNSYDSKQKAAPG